MSDATSVTWWDSLATSVQDGFGTLIEAGIDRAAQEIAPPSASEVSQNPYTHAHTQNVGPNADGTTVSQPVPGSGVVPGVSNTKLLLIGGAVLLGGALFLRRR